MPVSGVIVRCEAEAVGDVRRRIEAHPAAEAREVRGRDLIVVTDTRTLDEDAGTVEWLGTIPGVVSTHITFVNVEDVAGAEAAGTIHCGERK